MARKTKDPGFGYKSKANAQSVINDDGSSNVQHINRKTSINDLYTYFIDISWIRFFILIVLIHVIKYLFWNYLCFYWY